MSNLLNKFMDQFTDHDDDDEMMRDEEMPAGQTPNPGSTPVPPRAAAPQGIGRTAMPVRQAKPYTVVVVNPSSYKDAEKIGDHLKQSCPVVLNLEKTAPEEAARVIDFVSGIMYALNGDIDRISDSIFLCAPNNMSIDKENYAAYSAASGTAADGEPLQWKVPQ